jgi:hypothetical protein
LPDLPLLWLFIFLELVSLLLDFDNPYSLSPPSFNFWIISLLLIFLSKFLNNPSPYEALALQTNFAVESLTSALGSFNRLSKVDWIAFDFKNYTTLSDVVPFSIETVIHFIILFFIPGVLSLRAIFISYPTYYIEKQ